MDICAPPDQFLVTPLLVGPVCLLSQGRFREPVCPCKGFSPTEKQWRQFGLGSVRGGDRPTTKKVKKDFCHSGESVSDLTFIGMM